MESQIISEEAQTSLTFLIPRSHKLQLYAIYLRTVNLFAWIFCVNVESHSAYTEAHNIWICKKLGRHFTLAACNNRKLDKTRISTCTMHRKQYIDFLFHFIECLLRFSANTNSKAGIRLTEDKPKGHLITFTTSIYIFGSKSGQVGPRGVELPSRHN